VRREAFAVIGAVAEHSTHVRERRTDEDTTFEVATGIQDGDKGWRGHGHVLVIHIQMPARSSQSDLETFGVFETPKVISDR
jgi:hypothetical protein